jgi:glycosyltransferase involved in cell wall biosynthesis
MIQAAFLAQRQSLPVLLELHDRVTGKLGPFMFRHLLGRRGKVRFLPITHMLQQALERDFGYSFAPGEVVVSPDGVDLERYTDLPDAAAARRQLGLRESPTVGYSGHLYAGRGLDLLLALAQSQPQVEFLWVGGRPEDVNRWQGRLARAGVQNVHLTGFVPNAGLPLYQAASDILVMPYERSIATSSGGNTVDFCSPMKMFEYLAAGRVILSSDLPVLHEVLNPGNAVFCPPDNVQAWQTVLAGLLADPELRCQLGQQARRDAVRFSWQARAAGALQGFEPFKGVSS